MNVANERLESLLRNALVRYAEKYHIVIVPGFLSKKFVAYCSMKEDLELIINYISILRANPSQIIKSAFCFSTISLYGKCFTDASKNNYPKLEPKTLFEGEIELANTHEYLIELRHQFIAHRGKTDNEIAIAYLLFSKNDTDALSQLRFSQLKQTSFSTKDLDRIETLLKHLIEILKVKIQKSGQKVHDGMFNEFSAEHLAMMRINNMK